MSLHFFIPIFLSILINLLVSPASISLARKFRLVDLPDSAPHKVHLAPVPRGGGISISLVIFLLSLVSDELQTPDIRTILIASIVILIFGIWDDVKGLAAPIKLIGQILATVILVNQGIQIRMFGDLVIPNLGLTFLWIVGITNAFNLVDSMDGLATGLAAIAAAFFFWTGVGRFVFGILLF